MLIDPVWFGELDSGMVGEASEGLLDGHGGEGENESGVAFLAERNALEGIYPGSSKSVAQVVVGGVGAKLQDELTFHIVGR